MFDPVAGRDGSFFSIGCIIEGITGIRYRCLVAARLMVE